MSENGDDNGFWAELKREVRDLFRLLGDGWRQGSSGFRNWLRRLRRARLDYVVIPIAGPLPERSAPPRSFIQRQLPLPPEPLSIQELNARLQAIADAENVRGVVFLLRDFAVAGLATLQSLRRSIERLRQAGKEAVVFTPYLDLAHYYVACAADRIIAPPGVFFEVLGLRVEALFLREALERIGVHPDVIQISPYKTGYNIFEKAEITPEQREMLNWILDDNFEVITSDIAAGRNLAPEEVKALIDRAPLFAEEALASGLVDTLAYEDQLARILAPAPRATEDAAEVAAPTAGPTRAGEAVEARAGNAEEAVDDAEQEEDDGEAEEAEARILAWSEAAGLLLEKARRPFEQFIGVVSVEGAIATGPSRQPPVDLPIPFLGGAVAGHETITRLLRQAERERQMAALILHVDSGGGSALASDLIWRQLARIARKKPVVVYMGNVAASGGYYVGAPAQHIISQPGTLTGSIGVLLPRFNIDQLYEKLHVNRTSLQRGEHADLYSGTAPLTAEEREILWEGVVHSYRRFKEVVAEGRGLPLEEIDAVALGRVWTGRQAQARRLVDSHGDFLDAVRIAIELAKLPVEDLQRVPVANFHDRSQRYLTPLPFGEALPVRLKACLDETVAQWNGKPLALLPFDIRFR